MQVLNWLAKGLLSYVCVKEKALVSIPNLASTTWLSKRLMSLKRMAGHYVTPLTVVAQGSVIARQREAAMRVPATANRSIVNASRVTFNRLQQLCLS